MSPSEDFSNINLTGIRAKSGSKESIERNIRKYLLLMFIVFAVFITFVVVRRISDVFADSSLTQDEVAYDFGKIREGEVLGHDFIINNDGTLPVSIVSIFTSCDCVEVKSSGSTIDPKNEVAISVVFYPDEVDFDSIKKISKFITVKTNNIRQPEVRFVIKAETVPSF